MGKKLKSLYQNLQANALVTSPHLREMGISPQLVQKYQVSGWLEMLAPGVYKRPQDVLKWQGALHGLQSQRELPVHVAGLTALAAYGHYHYLRLGRDRIFLNGPTNFKLPAWFMSHDWQADMIFTSSKLFPDDRFILSKKMDEFELKVSSPERAMLEALHLTPNKVSLVECYQILENLRLLRPDVMADLLINCNSIKVRRLFLYMAEKAKLPVLNHLDVTQIPLGTGNRALVKEGIYIAKYGLVLPKELVGYAWDVS